MKLAIQILAIVFLMGTIAKTFSFERVEIVKKHEWDLSQEEQDSIQLIQEEDFRSYSDSINFEYSNLETYKCEKVDSVIGVCKLKSHQNDFWIDYISLIVTLNHVDAWE